MKLGKLKNVIIGTLIVGMLCSSCTSLKTQQIIDNILPEYDKRMYNVADLIPYSYKELKDAQAYYGMQLQDFFMKNTATKSAMSRTKDEQLDFVKTLRYRTYNYKTIQKRYTMFDDVATETKDKAKYFEDEFNAYYNLKDAESANVIKEYNDGKLGGATLLSIMVDLSTATLSDASSIFTEAECYIYKPVVISNEQYNNLQVGDYIELELPVEDKNIENKETYKQNMYYIAKDTLTYKKQNDDGEYVDQYYFIAEPEGTSNYRRILAISGMTVETYDRKEKLQFMNHTRVITAYDQDTLMDVVINEKEKNNEFSFDKMVENAMCGGYLTEQYKDFIFANSVTTNAKGYITALTCYVNQRLNNEFVMEQMKKEYEKLYGKATASEAASDEEIETDTDIEIEG